LKGKLDPRDTMRLYGVVLGVLFLFYLLGLFLGRNQIMEARPKEVSLPMADTALADIEPGLDFYQRLMGPSVTESDPLVSEDVLPAVSVQLGESPTTAEQSGALAFDVYTVQVGAFTAEIDARQILIRLEARGHASVLMNPSASDPYYRVYVGEFATDLEALAMEEKLRKDGFLTYIKKIQISSATH
jgi:cell division septation protein DedD